MSAEVKVTVECCPHCGGTKGLYLTFNQTYEQYFAWSGENQGPTEPDGQSPKIARCSDCRKRVTSLAKKIKPFNAYNNIPGIWYDMGESIL